ncbi:hypothetical protein F4778DRAFT_778227 [Xylariomycetidae sp. FL2044]|nr:hypothetical protein F4778DRAFT_778227 [Xylariomycetidae sp. FL2044]
MAQGAPKKSSSSSSSKRPTATARSNKPQPPKKGARVIKAKKGGSTADKLQKKYSAGLVAKTEKLLGERAGHLELIGLGKKGRKEGAEEEGKGTKGKGKTGGSRKFG